LAAIIGLGAVIAGLSFYGAWWIVFPGIPLIAYYFYLIAGLNHHEVKRKNKIMAVVSAIITFVLNGITGIILLF
jgi:hypothetical protein